MARYLLDTDVIIDALHRKRGRPELLHDLVLRRHVLGCCSINVTELYAGMDPSEEAATLELLSGLEYYQVTLEAAQTAGRLRRDLARRGRTLSLADATIAAVALTQALILITGNSKDYPIPQLVLYSPPAAGS